MTRQVLTEATAGTTATPVEGKPGRFLVQLISPGWGSSGYYSAEVLEAAGKAGVFGKGLHQYLDHPTATEQYDRPERSVRDLAAALEEDAHWDADLQALVAETTVFGPFRQLLDPKQGGIGDAIGVSIRAAAEVTPGEAEGRHGPIITELVEGISADYVTHAGRGGKILQVIESAHAAAVDEATANDTRAALERALTDAYGGERQYVGVRDFDESTVWFYQYTPDHEGLYQIGYSLAEDGAVSLSGSPVEVRAKTVYVPVGSEDSEPAAESTPTTDVPATRPGSTSESTTQEEPSMGTIQVDEAQHAALVEKAGRVSTLESERDTAIKERDDAVAERDKLQAREAERTRESAIDKVLREAIEAANGVTLNEFERAGVRGRAVVADSAVDEAKTREAFDKALAAIAESHGAGRPRGLGGPVRTNDDNEAVAESDFDELDDAVFGKIQEA